MKDRFKGSYTYGRSEAYVVHSELGGQKKWIATFATEEEAKRCSGQYNKYVRGEIDYVSY